MLMGHATLLGGSLDIMPIMVQVSHDNNPNP